MEQVPHEKGEISDTDYCEYGECKARGSDLKVYTVGGYYWRLCSEHADLLECIESVVRTVSG